jgi:hypothetical protein
MTLNQGWDGIAARASKPASATSSAELRHVLDHFQNALSTLPRQEAKGDPSFLLAELDSLEELRIHAASQLL